MAKVWPVNAEKKSLDDVLRERQVLTLVCGVGGCQESWDGRFDDVIAARDAHRAEHHPDFRMTRRRRQGRKIIVEEVPAPK